MTKKSGALGNGISAWIGDMLPFTPSSMRRAGAAHLMARRMGRDPGFLVKHPLASQFLALGAGGYLASQVDGTTARLATALAPMALTQVLKRKSMTDIAERYKETKRRKRLRDIEGLDEMIDDQTGSTRLGMVRALGMMKRRKQNLSAVAEAADGLPLAAGLTGGGLGGMALTAPLTELIDHIESNRLRKSAGLDQASGATIPLFLLAAAATAGGQSLAIRNLNNQFAKQQPIDRQEWDRTVSDVSGNNPVTVSLPSIRNAFHSKPRSEAQIDAVTRLVAADPFNQPKFEQPKIQLPTKARLVLGLLTGSNSEADGLLSDRRAKLQEWYAGLRQRVADSGVVAADPAVASRAVLAHEGGHANIEATPGVLRFLQRHVYPYRKVVAPLAGVGSMAAGLASGSTLGGALAGAGIGLASGAVTLAPEYMSSWKALRSLQSKGVESVADRKALLSALATYAAGAVIPSAVAGAAGGWLAGRRKKKPEHDTDETGEPVDAEKEAAVSREAANLILHRLSLYKDMVRIANDLGRNAGIRFGETNRIAHAGNPFSWSPMRRDKGLIELTGGVMPRSIDRASDAVRKYLGSL